MRRQAARASGRGLGYITPFLARTTVSNYTRDAYLQLAAIVILHFSIALIYKEVRGLDIQANPGGRDWDWWWQTIPARLLREKPWESLFYLHYQPPLFNVYGALFHNLFPSNALEAMQVGNIFLGSAITGFVYLTVRLRAQMPLLALLAGLVVALDPGLFLFEAYILYDILTAFWLVSGVYFFSKYQQQHRLRYALLFFVCLNSLVLTRSAYHLLIVPVAIIIIALASEKQWRKVVVIGLLVSLFSVGWYAKNYVVFGFFGSSSWRGMSLWKIASYYYDEAELVDLATSGVLEPMVVEQAPFSPASSYRGYGYARTSGIELLAQDDRHNINLIAIDHIYEANALRLILHEPERYLRAIGRAYQVYALPLPLFRHHSLNAEKIYLHAALSSELVEGHILQRFVAFEFGSIYFLGIPLILLTYGGYIAIRIRKEGRRLQLLIRESVELWIVFLIVYTTLVSIIFEIGENNRLRFYIEYLLFTLLLIMAWRIASLIAARKK